MSLVGWMVYALGVAVLVGAAAWCLDRGLARIGLPTRWTWAGAMVASAVLPLAALVLPGAPMTEEGTLAPATVAAPAAGAEALPLAADPVPATHRMLIAAITAQAIPWAGQAVSRTIQAGAGLIPTGPAVTRWTAAAWAAGSLALGALLLGSGMALARRRRGWPRARVLHHPVRVAPDLGPAVVGLVRPEIVLPPWAVAMGLPDLRLVLAHEREHIRARDPLLLAAGLTPLVLVPWNPVLWWQLRRLRDAVELDCDRRVLRLGAPARRYGDLLLRMGSRTGRDVLPVPAMAGSPSLLERRLHAMKKRSVRAAVPLAVVAVLAAVGLLTLACEADTPTTTAADDAEVATESPSPERAALMESRLSDIAPDPLMVVDGVIAPSGALELRPEDIHSIEVLKGAAAVGTYGDDAAGGVVLLTTVDGAAERAVGSPGAADAHEAFTVTEVDRRSSELGELERTELVGRVQGARITPGPRVVQSSQADGSGVRVRFRNQSELDGALRDADDGQPRPLMVVDGVIMSAEILDLEALDIERIEVLKGAAAAHLYGSRAADGVVEITTRGGGR